MTHLPWAAQELRPRAAKLAGGAGADACGSDAKGVILAEGVPSGTLRAALQTIIALHRGEAASGAGRAIRVLIARDGHTCVCTARGRAVPARSSLGQTR